MLTQRIDDHGQSLSLLARRQQLLAANVANADTPGYRAVDIDFAQALQQARGRQGGALAVTRATHFATGASGQVVAAQARHAEQPSIDGNTVDLDRERAEFADNALRYEATLRFASHDVRTILSAITGQ